MHTKEAIKPKPNLFKFATGELSQDAFICWSLAWGQQNEDIQMKTYGLSLLNTMLTKHDYHVDDLSRITITNVQNQLDAIDVLVTFRLNGQEFELIIEDKINTSMHSNQLKRYFDKRRKQSPDKVILGIYYKTGFIFDDEDIKLETLRKNNYPVKRFDKAAILYCMRPYIDLTESDVFHDYYQYIKAMFDREQTLLQNLHSTDFGRVKEGLSTQMGQVTVIKSIFGNVNVNRGNSYGRPWVHYAFKKGNRNHTLQDRLFYRIDKKKKGVYISLRQFRDLKKEVSRKDINASMEKLKHDKLDRLHKLTQIFDKVMIGIKNDFPERYIEPGKRSIDRTGQNESEVGIFYFTEENTVERFGWFFEVFHQRFSEGIDEVFGIY